MMFIHCSTTSKFSRLYWASVWNKTTPLLQSGSIASQLHKNFTRAIFLNLRVNPKMRQWPIYWVVVWQKQRYVTCAPGKDMTSSPKLWRSAGSDKLSECWLENMWILHIFNKMFSTGFKYSRYSFCWWCTLRDLKITAKKRKVITSIRGPQVESSQKCCHHWKPHKTLFLVSRC